MPKNKKQIHKPSGVACVVGGSGGIGSAIVDALSRDYAHVWNFDRVVKSPNNAIAIDVADPAAVSRAIGTMIDRDGTPTAVVFAPTAPLTPKSLNALQWADVDRHLQVSLRGFFTVFHELLPLITSGSPMRIVVLATEGVIGKPPSHMADYLAAKHALLGFAKSAALEVGKYGASVNVVSPGMTETSLLGALPAKLVEAAAAANPMRRNATPHDVAAAVRFLVSPEAAYVNGAHLTVNGGSVML